MAELLQNGSVKMRNGRILWGKDIVQIIDLCELNELLVPPPKVIGGFQGFGGGGGRGPAGPAGAPGIQGPPGIISLVQDEGFNLPLQNTLNFIGEGVSVTNDPGNGRLNITIRDLYAATRIVSLDPAQGTDLTIQDALNNLPAEGGLIFVKQGVYPISAPLVIPNKPVAIYGAGRGATVLDISTNVISLFFDNFDQPRSYKDFTALGNGSVGQVFMEFGAGPQSDFFVVIDNVDIGRILVTGSEIETTFLTSPAGFPSVLAQNCIFLLPALATSLWWKGGSGGLSITDCVLASWDPVATQFRRGGCTGSPFITARGCGIAFENNAISGEASHFNDCYFYGFSGTSTFEIGDFSNIDGGILNDGTLILNILCTVVGVLLTLSVGAPVARYIDIPAGMDSCRVTSCLFSGSTSESIRVASSRNIISDNNDCNVTEIGAANNNLYSNNEGFFPSTIIGANSLVNNENVVTVAIDTLLTGNSRTVAVDASGASRTITLPLAADVKFIVYTIKKIDATANTVTIDPNGGQLIDGVLTQVLTTQWQALRIQSDGTQWFII